MNADAGATDGAISPITQPPQNSYPRSSAAKYSCLRRQPGRPRPPPPRPSTPSGPPSTGTQIPPPQPVRPERQTIAAPCPSSPPSSAPRGEPTRLSAAPSRSARKKHLPAGTRTPRETASAPNHPRQGNPHHPPTRIRPPEPVRPEKPPPHPTTPGRATHTTRQPACARRNPYAQRNRALPPPHLRALRALRGGSSFLPGPAPHPAAPSAAPPNPPPNPTTNDEPLPRTHRRLPASRRSDTVRRRFRGTPPCHSPPNASTVSSPA